MNPRRQNCDDFDETDTPDSRVILKRGIFRANMAVEILLLIAIDVDVRTPV